MKRSIMSLDSFDELLERDKQREEDGFKKKIRIRRILIDRGKVIVIPYVEEEKLIHGDFEPTREHGEDEAGQGEGKVGDVIIEIPLRGDEDGEGDEDAEEGEDSIAGEGEGQHGIETGAYQLGKELSEKLQLPNLREKSKKVPTNEYVYDLTDRHRKSGQLLDIKETLKSIIKGNLALGRFDIKHIDPTKLVVAPQFKIFRILSRERAWKSQAVVFFLRDYSGSMEGDPTQAVVNQHLMIFSWLLFEHEHLVIPRFIVHDTVAKEVSVRSYFTENAGGGTLIPSGYHKINEIVESEELAKDYNVYVFQGTDGDDSDDGEKAIPEIEKILTYVNRMGVSVLKRPYLRDKDSVFEKYIKASGFLEIKDLFRMHVMSSQDVTDEDNEEAIKVLVAQD